MKNFLIGIWKRAGLGIKYKTSGWKVSLMIIKLMNHAAKGITSKGCELLGKKVIMWQMGAGAGALVGVP